jgi:hypothetical protein
VIGSRLRSRLVCRPASEWNRQAQESKEVGKEMTFPARTNGYMGSR